MLSRLDFDPDNGLSSFQLSLFRKIIDKIFKSNFQDKFKIRFDFCEYFENYYSNNGHCFHIYFEEDVDNGIFINIDSVNIIFRRKINSDRFDSRLIEIDSFSSFSEMEDHTVDLFMEMLNSAYK